MTAMATDVDAVFVNGTVLQMDRAGAVAEAFAVRGDTFAAVGRTGEIRALKGPATTEIDLGGRTVLPGFNDSHNHMLETGLELATVQLGRVRSMDALLEVIRREAVRRPDGEWIRCSAAWHESQLAERRLPTRAELDAVAPRNPVYLPRGGHVLVVNGLALRIAGIGPTTSCPGGADIKRDPRTGEPTGLLLEPPAMALVRRHLPPPSALEKERAILSAMRAFHAAGITSVIEPGLAADEIALYRRLRADGRLTMRTTAMVGLGCPGWPDASGDAVRQLGPYERATDATFRVDGIKLFADGGIESALLGTPHCVVPGEQEHPRYHGVQALETERLDDVVRAANRTGWRVGVHAVGDAAIDLVLAAFARADRESPLAGKRWMLIHGLLPKEEHYGPLRAMGIVVAAQVHHYALGDNMLRYWGAERASRANPIRGYLGHGITVAGGTDAMVCPYDQGLAVWAQIARRTQQGATLGAELGLARQDAVALHTRAGSWATFEETRKGTIERGALADFVVLSANPLTCPMDELRELRVRQTFVGGRQVWPA